MKPTAHIRGFVSGDTWIERGPANGTSNYAVPPGVIPEGIRPLYPSFFVRVADAKERIRRGESYASIQARHGSIVMVQAQYDARVDAMRRAAEYSDAVNAGGRALQRYNRRMK